MKSKDERGLRIASLYRVVVFCGRIFPSYVLTNGMRN
jgi:hypothetical protein